MGTAMHTLNRLRAFGVPTLPRNDFTLVPRPPAIDVLTRVLSLRYLLWMLQTHSIKVLVIMLPVLELSLAKLSDAELRPTPAQSCEAAKNAAVGKLSACLASENAKDLRGRPSNSNRCRMTFVREFRRAETLAVARRGECATVGDVADLEGVVHVTRSQVAKALIEAPVLTPSSVALECTAAKNEEAGEFALCLAKEDAKLAKGKDSDPSACRIILARSFSYAESAAEAAGGSCATRDDADAIASLLETAQAGMARALLGGRDRLGDLFGRAFQPITSQEFFTEPVTPSHHCLAAASAYRRAPSSASFSPSFIASLLAATRASAGWLVANVGKWGGYGWGLDFAWDAFGDGTKNSVDTVYAFQTGLATWCLAEAASVTGDASYRALADRVLSEYRRAAFVPAGPAYPIDCPSCGYFWYSTNANDVSRFVKNTNIEMAVASLVLDRYGADAAARTVGEAAAASQLREIRDAMNYGYFGRFDPYFSPSANRFDDHNSFEAYLLLRAGELLGSSDHVAAARDHYMAYVTHGSRNYVAYSACHLARVLPAAERTCVGWVTAHGATNPAGVGLVMDYR